LEFYYHGTKFIFQALGPCRVMKYPANPMHQLDWAHAAVSWASLLWSTALPFAYMRSQRYNINQRPSRRYWTPQDPQFPEKKIELNTSTFSIVIYLKSTHNDSQQQNDGSCRPRVRPISMSVQRRDSSPIASRVSGPCEDLACCAEPNWR
jgi:hypothetical protein